MFYLIALAALVVSADAAHAAPLIAPIIGAVFGIGAAAAGVVASIVVGVASIGLSLLLRPKQPAEQGGGVELQTRSDPLAPETLIVGRAVTGGTRVAPPTTYGNNNQNCIEFIALADHPCEGLVKAFVDGQEAALTDTATTRGFTVDGYDAKLALRFFDGSQTDADAFAVAALSAHPERPWTNDHKGLGRTFARLHSIYDKEKVPGLLPWKFVVDGIPLYDPRLDTTVGGSGAHRFADLDTHAFTANLAVIAYNIVRGIRVKDENGDPVHFYGLKGTPAANVPLDVWFAAMNEADVPVALDAGGTEPQFHGGLEIQVSTEPLEAIRQVLKATGGRFVENGGIYKLYLGAPGLPVATFDDGIVPANRSDLFEPILPLERKVTYVAGTFVSPDDGWIEKEAPVRIDTALEDSLGDRFEADLDAPMVQSGPHMQRLMQQVLARAKQQHRHSLPLPPALFGVEPGDVLEWNSERNGYEDKLFEVTGCEIDASLITVAHLLEVDPADYDWEASDELPQAIGSIVQHRPAPKIIDDFDAQPYTHIGTTGQKRAGIRYTWTPPEDDDLARFRIQIRLAASPTEIVNHDFDEPEIGAGIVLSGLAGATNYETRGRPESFNGFGTEWSLWIPITTPNVGVGVDELSAEMQALINQLRAGFDAWLAGKIDALQEQIEQMAAANAGAYAVSDENLNESVKVIGQRVGGSEAQIIQAQSAIAENEKAIADFFVGLRTINPQGEAETQFRISAAALPEGALGGAELSVRAGVGGAIAKAALRLLAFASPGGAIARAEIEAEQADIIFPSGRRLKLQAVGQTDGFADAPLVAGNIEADLFERDQAHYTLLDDDATLRFPKSAPGVWFYFHAFEQDGTGGRTLTPDPTAYIGDAPTYDTDPGVVTVWLIIILSLDPPLALPVFLGAGVLAAGTPNQFTISPPVDGRSLWDLTVHGACDITVPGTYIITPIGEYLDAKFTLIGPGGSSGAAAAAVIQPTAGTPTTFEGQTANPGGFSTSLAPAGTDLGTGGAGGAASGGDTDTTGDAGGNGTSPGANSARGGIGPGGQTPFGGSDITPTSVSAALPVGSLRSRDGDGRTEVGAGATGACRTYRNSDSSSFRNARGGGGEGGKSIKTYGEGDLDQGVAYELVVGEPGTRGASSGGSEPAEGGVGGPGGARIEAP